jgi:hypothetical protein
MVATIGFPDIGLQGFMGLLTTNHSNWKRASEGTPENSPAF